MTKLQKIALFNLSLAGACLLLQLLNLIVRDLPIRLFASVTSLILCGFLVVSYFRRRKIAKQGASQYDERDKAIHTKAALTGLIVAFIVFFVTTLIAFLGVGPGGSVEIGLLLTIFQIGAMSFFATESATVLLRYGWGAGHGEK
jgi:hypothetical protein